VSKTYADACREALESAMPSYKQADGIDGDATRAVLARLIAAEVGHKDVNFSHPLGTFGDPVWAFYLTYADELLIQIRQIEKVHI